MPHTFAALHYHLVFSTKHRDPVITPAVRPRLHEYLGGAIRAEGGSPLAVGGTADHVHLLVGLGASKAVADVLRVVKANSSKWVRETLPDVPGFGWQAGYGAFTVSIGSVEGVRRYVLNQKEHHKTITFQDEFRGFLERHGIAFDERYLWN